MHQAVRQSRRTIAVLSNDYLAAPHTTAEWAAAFAGDPAGTGGVLLSVRVRACEPAGLLRAIVYLDLLGVDEAAASGTLLAGRCAAQPEAGVSDALRGRLRQPVVGEQR
jgi:hypothetical protein